MVIEASTTVRPRYKAPTIETYRPGPSLANVRDGASILRGHSGEDVRAIQRALNAAGIQPPLAEDGLFGPKTQAAVREFQESRGLAPTGAVDRAMLDRLGPQPSFGPSDGSRAPRVGEKAPDGTIRAGTLQQQDQARRARAEREAPVDGVYDGKHPAPGTDSTRRSYDSNPPLTNREGERSGSTYAQVIDQFAVGNNPRHLPRDGKTYCNIFAWDVTRAMGAEIPHWVDREGNPKRPGEKGADELSANGVHSWLNKHGSEHGWQRVSAEEAQRRANEGRPSVAIHGDPGGIGHVAVVRPGEITDRGPAIAQAGAWNFNNGHVHDVWAKRAPVEYWVHN